MTEERIQIMKDAIVEYTSRLDKDSNDEFA